MWMKVQENWLCMAASSEQKRVHVWCNVVSSGRGNMVGWRGRAKGNSLGSQGTLRGKGGLSTPGSCHSRSGFPGCLAGWWGWPAEDSNRKSESRTGHAVRLGQKGPAYKEQRDWASGRIPRGLLTVTDHRASVLFPKADPSLSEDGVWTQP